MDEYAYGIQFPEVFDSYESWQWGRRGHYSVQTLPLRL